MKSTLVLCLSVLLFVSCNSNKEDQLITVDNKFSIMLPGSMEAGKDLNDDAALQYQNIWQELYIIVIEESKTEVENAFAANDLNNEFRLDVEEYNTLITNAFSEGIGNSTVNAITDTVMNNMKCKITTIEGDIENVKAFYTLGICESETHFYQVLTWTLADKKADHFEKMKKMIYSFKEVKK